MSDLLLAQLISFATLAIVMAVLMAVRTRVALATANISYQAADGTNRSVSRGQIIPAADVPLAPAGGYSTAKLSLLRSVVVGADNRASTSKTVTFAWTLAIVYGLWALVIAKWLGSASGYTALGKHGLQEEYWLFLGGSFAAAVAAKYSATTQSPSNGKAPAAVGSATVTQLVTNDQGQSDLGDLQYVLFNLLALAVYFGNVVPHLDGGLPSMPSVITGLALTAAGGYSAKKLFLQQAPPVLNSLAPGAVKLAVAGADPPQIDVWGTSIIISGDASPDGTALMPTVTIGGVKASVVGGEQTLGADHIVVAVPDGAPVGQAVKVAATRADGSPAKSSVGGDSLPITVVAAG